MSMMSASLTGLDNNKFKRWLLVFFFALALPASILIYQAYSQLKWEAFHIHRLQAEELVKRIDKRFRQLIDTEEARLFTDYTFLNVAGDSSASFLQRSPLSGFPVDTPVPGLIGYFQVDAEGGFSSPLLPLPITQADSYGISPKQLRQRLKLEQTLRQILSRNQLVENNKPIGVKTLAEGDAGRQVSIPTNGKSTPKRLDLDQPITSAVATSPQGMPEDAVFDQLDAFSKQQKKKQKAAKLGRVEDLELDYSFQKSRPQMKQEQVAKAPQFLEKEKRARKERNVLPEAEVALSKTVEARTVQSRPLSEAKVAGRVQNNIPIHTFESEIDPLEFALLDSGHFVLYRKVWRDGQRFIQGMLIQQQVFLQNIIETAFRDTALSEMSNLIIAYQGNVFTAFHDDTSRNYLSSAEELQGAVLYQTRLSDPLGELELIFSITRLPAGPGSTVIAWLALILSIVLCSGFYLMYRLGIKQIELTRQQQDFVSAVSHELKTPLTSIRMYGEMLREGWAVEEKKQSYYDYIYDESERLSRLINNVLQLARMTRSELQLELKKVTVTELLDGIRSTVASQLERTGFELKLNCNDEASLAMVEVDSDGFTQIIINLLDNAIKFSTNAERKTIDLKCSLLRDGSIQFSVRDYGPGIAKDQMKKIFKLFYRSGNELTRETVGTGIGLALVYQLATAMDGKVDVVNRNPGAEFRLKLNAL